MMLAPLDRRRKTETAQGSRPRRASITKRVSHAEVSAELLFLTTECVENTWRKHSAKSQAATTSDYTSEVQETTMRARKSDKTSKLAVRKPAKRAAQGKAATTLPESMVTGKASPAQAAVGDEPVFAYIASLPHPQRGIAECIDALAAKTLPGLQRSVKWGMSYYGVGDGWCFCCGGFAGHVKLMFVSGAALVPVPPVTPVAMGKSTRGVELESVDDRL